MIECLSTYICKPSKCTFYKTVWQFNIFTFLNNLIISNITKESVGTKLFLYLYRPSAYKPENKTDQVLDKPQKPKLKIKHSIFQINITLFQGDHIQGNKFDLHVNKEVFFSCIKCTRQWFTIREKVNLTRKSFV